MSWEELKNLGEVTYFGNSLRTWAIAVVQFAVWFTVLPLARAFVSRQLRERSGERPVGALLLLRTLLDSTKRIFGIAVALWLAVRWLNVPEQVDRVVHVALLVVLWAQVGLWLSAVVHHAIESRRGHEVAGTEGAASLNILRFLGLLVAWTIALLMLLSTLGVKIGPLIAGLGIGGIAVALAVQSVLGDLMASLAIALDKPFRVGDFLITGDEKGTVERIGIKSTHLRSLSGELIVMPNGELLGSRLRNYTRMSERRIAFSIGIIYETPRDLVRAVPGILEQAIRAQDKARFDRAHFASFGDFSLNFEAVYYVLDKDYSVYMDVQQAINNALMEAFEERGIEFAYPTNKQFSVTLPSLAEAN